METKGADKFENVIYQAMKETGLLFPITDQEIEEFESRFTEVPLPERLKNPEAILNRNHNKISINPQPMLQVAALFDSGLSPEISKSDSTAKKKKKK